MPESHLKTGKKDEGKAREVPIIVVRGKKIPVMYAPPKPIEITAIVGSGTVSFHLPFDEYPVDVEIEGIIGICKTDRFELAT